MSIILLYLYTNVDNAITDKLVCKSQLKNKGINNHPELNFSGYIRTCLSF